MALPFGTQSVMDRRSSHPRSWQGRPEQGRVWPGHRGVVLVGILLSEMHNSCGGVAIVG